MRRVIIEGKRVPVGKILCLGKNYAAHAREMNSDAPRSPIIFMKPSTAIIGNGEEIVIPQISKNVHHEVELVVALGKDARNIRQDDAFDFVAGYAIGLDMTMRDKQNEAKEGGNPWTISKGFDTSAPISRIVSKKNISDPQNLTIECRVNGAIRQRGWTGDMIFTIARIIEYASSLFTLERGDLIFTGTPEGVGRVRGGDTIEAELVGHVSMSNSVREG